MRKTVLSVSFLVCLLGANAPAAAVCQTTPASVSENRDAATRLKAARQLLEDGKPDATTKFINQIIADSGDDLVRDQLGHYVAVRTKAQKLLAKLPGESLDKLREEQGPRANQWMQRARDGEPGLLGRILRDAPLTRAADQALFLLGAEAWQRDQPGLAYEYWRRLLTFESNQNTAGQFPDSRYPQAEIAARLVLCRLAMDDVRFARRELEAFKTSFPRARGTIAGRTGDLGSILESQFGMDWRPQPAGARTMPVWRPVWSRPVRLVTKSLVRPATPIRFPTSPPLLSHGTFIGDKAIVPNALSIGFFDTTSSDPQPFGIRLAAEAPPASSNGVPVFGIAAEANRLLLRAGSPVTVSARRSQRSGSNEIVCRDVRERDHTRSLWRIASGNLATGGAFESEPQTFGGRCFVVLRTVAPRSALEVCCLDLGNGAVLWRKQVCTDLDQAADEAGRVTNVRPIVSATHVTIPTDNGVIVSLDHEGRFAWAFEYSRSRHKPQRWESRTPAVSKFGQLFVAPADSSVVFSVREHTGELLWQRELPDRVSHVVDIANGVCIVNGRAPWGLEAATGRVLWGGPRQSPIHFGFGRGIVDRGVFYFPTQDQIEVRSVRTGHAVAAPLQFSGGNMAVSEDGRKMLVVGPKTAQVYESD